MAKIKQVKMRLGIDLGKPWKETVVSICYDSTDRRTEQYSRPIPKERFYINLPQIVADALGTKDVRANDQKVVMERFEEALEKFKRLKTEINQVIVYSFDVDPKPGKSNSWDTGYRVFLVAGVFEETVMIAGDGSRRYSYERVEHDLNTCGEHGNQVRNNGDRQDKQVPLNDKNGAFFLWIKKNMELLIKSLYELEQPDKLIEMVHAGRLLPLGNQREGDTE